MTLPLFALCCRHLIGAVDNLPSIRESQRESQDRMHEFTAAHHPLLPAVTVDNLIDHALVFRGDSSRCHPSRTRPSRLPGS